jgi:hypothetical protein
MPEKTSHLDDKYDRTVEHYELSWLVERIQRVLDEKGVLTVEDYRRELMGARADGSREPSGD